MRLFCRLIVYVVAVVSESVVGVEGVAILMNELAERRPLFVEGGEIARVGVPIVRAMKSSGSSMT